MSNNNPANVHLVAGQVRRRSSLDDAQIRALQQQLAPALHEDSDCEDVLDTKKTSPRRSGGLVNNNGSSGGVYIKPLEWKSLLKSALLSLLLGLVLATFLLLVWTCLLPALERGKDALEMDSDMLEQCLQNSTRCLQHSIEQFRLEWQQQQVPVPPPPSTECASVCDYLLQKLGGQTSSTMGSKLANACKIGCAYAAQEFASQGLANCQYECKNTVWVLFPQRAVCNYDKGVGLATFDLEKRFGEGVFGSGKACELGCIVGNSRPCPACDLDVRLHA